MARIQGDDLIGLFERKGLMDKPEQNAPVSSAVEQSAPAQPTAPPSKTASVIGDVATAPLQVLAAPVRAVSKGVDALIKDDTNSKLLGGINKAAQSVSKALTPKAIGTAGDRAVVGAADTIDSFAAKPAAAKAGWSAMQAKSASQAPRTAANIQLAKDYTREAQEADQKVAEIKARDISGNLLGESYKSFRAKTERDMADLSKEGQFIANLGYSAGQMLPDIAVSALTSGVAGGILGQTVKYGDVALDMAQATTKTVSAAAGLGAMFQNVYSNTYSENREAGYDIEASGKNALAKAAIEVGTEILGGGLALTEMGGLTEGALQKAGSIVGAFGEKLVAKGASDTAAKTLGNLTVGLGKILSNEYFTQIIGEGTEEWISEFLGPYADRLTIDPNADLSTREERMQAFLGGAIMSIGLEAPHMFIDGIHAAGQYTQ